MKTRSGNKYEEENARDTKTVKTVQKEHKTSLKTNSKTKPQTTKRSPKKSQKKEPLEEPEEKKTSQVKEPEKRQLVKMRTRSGNKFEDEKAMDTNTEKSVQKEHKTSPKTSPKTKPQTIKKSPKKPQKKKPLVEPEEETSQVKEPEKRQFVEKNKRKMQKNVEDIGPMLSAEPKKRPQRTLKSVAIAEPISETDNKIAKSEVKQTPAPNTVPAPGDDRVHPLMDTKETEEEEPNLKAKSEVKTIEENVVKAESKRTRSKIIIEKKTTEVVISPEEPPKSDGVSEKEEIVDTEGTEVKEKEKEKKVDLNAKIEIKSVQENTIKTKAKRTRNKTNTENKTKEVVINFEDSSKSNEIISEKEELMDTEEAEEKAKEEKETESIPMEPESTFVEEKSSESDPLPTKPESTSVKRKIGDSDALPPKPEAIKRLKVSRFSVPLIPQICGQLYSFGEEIAGELGPRLKRVDEIKLKSNEPSIVTDRDGLVLDNIVFVACGAMHSLCLSSEGEVIAFGCNDDSALGRDTQTGSDETDDSIDLDESEEKEAKTPKLVSGLPSVIKLTAGDMHTCALCKDGSVYVWGNFKDESKKLGLFEDSPKNGNNDDFTATTLPKQIQLETKIIDIASGCHHILLLTEDGDVLSFGEGSKGQLGRIRDNELQSISDDRKLFLCPQKVEFGVGVVVEAIWANHWSSYAKTSSGDIYVWGLNNYHQLGFKSYGSVEVTNSDPNESQTTINLTLELKPTKAEKMPKNIVMIANGQHHMLALDDDGQVFSCGSGTYGKLGYKADNSDQTVDSPQMISRDAFNGQKVTYIACGEFCSFAITESGHLMSWGQGSAHIGSGDFTDIEVPTRVKGSLADNTRYVSVSSGSQHSLLIGNKTTINGN